MTASKQLQVYQRKEPSSSKPMKSWVMALGEVSRNSFSEMPEVKSIGFERSRIWSDGRCFGSSSVGLLGEAPSVCMATREVIARASLAIGESEATGILGAYVVSAGEKICDEDPLSLLEVAALFEDFEQDDHGIGPEVE